VQSVFRLAVRAAAWRTTRELLLAGLPSLLGWTAVLAVLRMALQYVDAGSAPNFNPYGLNAVVAWLAIELAVAALFVRPAGRTTALAAMFVLSGMADIANTFIRFAISLLASDAGSSPFWTSTPVIDTIFAAETIWWAGAMVCVIRSLEVQSRRRLVGKVAALWLALFAANALVPHAPAFVARDFDVRNANWWEFLHAHYADRADDPQHPPIGDLAQIERSQPELLQAELTQLAPARKGVTNIYTIGIAGWADQDVFAKELDGGLAIIASVLPIKDRIIRLINHRATASRLPLANLRNFTAAVRAVAGLMDKDKDVLLLLMTSHGNRNGFALQFPGTAITELTPQQVATALDGEGVKNRVVIVSACFAGIFLPPLANDNTIVMTAADQKSTSFGCSPERDWTYFGDALFRQSMQPGMDFQRAFEHARVLIHGWELMDGDPPSNPQGHFGSALVARLAPLFQSPHNETP
jgi:hypothetical protein